MKNGHQIFFQVGGNMKKVSAMVMDVNDDLTLNEKADDEHDYIKNMKNQVIWKHVTAKKDKQPLIFFS
jgi:hypothetical protein